MIKLGSNSIGKIYLGGNSIGKAYLGSNLVFQKGGSPTPPGPTVSIPYIRGGADGSYIDTGITPDATTRVIVWARNFNPATDYTWLFGSREAGMTEQFGVYGCITARTGKIGGLYASEFFYTGDAFSLMSGYHKYELNGNVFSVDDTVVATATASTITNNQSLYLFGINSNGNLSSPVSPIDICACQIYKGGVLVRDFTPANTPSVGLYDEVSQTMFTNAGNGSFTYGSFNENAYTPLSYIACDQQQYFDTGLYGNESTKVVTKFRPTGTVKTWYRLFGARNSVDGNTLMLELMIGNESYLNRYFYVRYKGSSDTVYNSASQTGNDLVYVHNANVFTLYKNNSQLGTKTVTASTFTTPYTMYVGSSNLSGSGTAYRFYGYIYYIGFGSDKNFVPAMVNNVAGMYDTYNDVFYPSATDTPFVAGPTI